jgi:N-methylhydantoinase B
VHRFNQPDEQHFPNGKAFNQVIKPGDAYILRSGGGGGFGSPLEREVDALQRDVTGGYVSKEAAEKYYGAVFESDSLAIDRAATRLRRAEMAAQGLPEDEPIAETVPLPQGPAHHHEHEHGHEHLTPEERAVLAMSHRCCS